MVENFRPCRTVSQGDSFMSARACPWEIAAAAAVLKAGGVVAFPTETVYGLGAEVSHPSAISAYSTSSVVLTITPSSFT